MTDVSTEAVEPAATMERRGGVALITFNRPRALNAVTAALSTAVGEALEEFAADPELRVAVVTGAGRAFCAGMDLKEAAAGRSVMAPGHDDWGFAGLVNHFVDKPVIAAVNGFALGGGTEIALACDLVVADENAQFGLPEVRRGLFAAAGGVLRLPRQVPKKIALEMALTGKPLDAAEAERWGLVNRVAAAGKSVEVALDLAEVVAAGAPLAVRASKRLIHHSEAFGLDRERAIWEENSREWQVVRDSDDALEGARAFAEKRAPVWQGR
ncbi:enoyl-CoA hydratase [Streptomyces sp. AS58]|uniref:crotonase/enoyl-CoA hydratase family protein n=1 Tax=Streptomyces sp. AS58 TaxID=1519489 RepID=UPI0006B03472|nr:crotonase/enoyl-CoA hydratase family protein [Streptomyces sp. AS58]KOV53282.1 enoyl-CoA hydratase [Streptomyces sp. AS58]